MHTQNDPRIISACVRFRFLLIKSVVQQLCHKPLLYKVLYIQCSKDKKEKNKKRKTERSKIVEKVNGRDEARGNQRKELEWGKREQRKSCEWKTSDEKNRARKEKRRSSKRSVEWRRGLVGRYNGSFTTERFNCSCFVVGGHSTSSTQRVLSVCAKAQFVLSLSSFLPSRTRTTFFLAHSFEVFFTLPPPFPENNGTKRETVSLSSTVGFAFVA